MFWGLNIVVSRSVHWPLTTDCFTRNFFFFVHDSWLHSKMPVTTEISTLKCSLFVQVVVTQVWSFNCFMNHEYETEGVLRVEILTG